MTLRDNLSDFSVKAWAHSILDDVRSGVRRTDLQISMALQALGDLAVESANA